MAPEQDALEKAERELRQTTNRFIFTSGTYKGMTGYDLNTYHGTPVGTDGEGGETVIF